ncbi:MAG: polysaccharide deacetylase family protein, partial [Acidimicrobiales bacterium]
MRGSRGRAAAALIAGGLAVAAMMLPSTPAAWARTNDPVAAASAGPAPAFYTFQAPGGQATAGRRDIALTFDDGPGPYTPQVLSVLESYHVPATFFEIGINAANYPQYTRMLAQAGYPVEDHTWTHPDLATL